MLSAFSLGLLYESQDCSGNDMTLQHIPDYHDFFLFSALALVILLARVTDRLSCGIKLSLLSSNEDPLYLIFLRGRKEILTRDVCWESIFVGQ